MEGGSGGAAAASWASPRLHGTVRYASLVASIRQMVKRYMPAQPLKVIQRRRALRRYLRSISYELYDRDRTYELEELEETLLARPSEITTRLMKDLLTRTDLLIQQLDRQIEGLRARHGEELGELRREVEAIRSSLDAMRAEAHQD